MKNILCGILAVIALAASAASTNAAVIDPIGGSVYDRDYLNGGQSMTYSVNVYGGEYTSVELAGYADLDLYVYDQRGNLLAASESYGGIEALDVYVWQPQTLRIVVRNRSSYGTWYEILIW